MKDYPNVHILDHPLIRHKVAYLRDVNTDTKLFRDLITEVATLMTYEAFKDDSVAIVPILRAGLGMVDGVFNLFPLAKVGHIGLYRNEETHEPVEYYCKLPQNIENMVTVVLDPMLATGGSASEAITMLKKRGCKKIKLMSIIAAPEGVTRMAEDHPDVEIYVSTLDRELNENCYILPGLGDAGDRIFGTK